MRRGICLVVVAAGLLLASVAEARVVRLVIERTRPFADGRSFGAAGAYERLDGTAFMEVDPGDPLNAVIVNLAKAPRNAKGLVEFSAPFVIIKPVNMARGNGKILYGLNNRGTNLEIPLQSYPGLGAGVAIDAGDGLMFNQGFTFVDAGWAGDIATSETRLGANLPIAVERDGRPVTARIRIEYTGTGNTLPIKGNAGFKGYEAAAPRRRPFPRMDGRSADAPRASRRSCRRRWTFVSSTGSSRT